MAKLKFKNPKTGLWEEAGGSLQNLKDGEKTSLYMDNTNEVTTPAGGTTLNPNPTPSTTSPTATGTGSFAIGSGTKATGDVSVAEGILNEASGKASHAEGAGTKAGGNTSHAEGFYTEAAGDYSYAGNYGTVAQGKKSHAEGGQTKAIGDCTHAEGDSTTAQGTGSHAEGAYTFANGKYSHAEGCGNNFEGADQKLIAGGTGAHAEGFITKAMGDYSHAEGYGTVAAGTASHAGGFVNKTSAPYSAVIGKYGEILGADDTRLFVVGNGTSETNRSNAFEVYADGTGYLNKKKILVEGDAGGGGDVTAAGNNTFTGTNTFKNESSFEGKVNIDDGITLAPKNVDTENTLSISVDENEGRIAAIRTLTTGGTVPKDISFVGSTLKDIGVPVANTDAANKKYVDDEVDKVPSTIMFDYDYSTQSLTATINGVNADSTAIQSLLTNGKAVISCRVKKYDSQGETVTSANIVSANYFDYLIDKGQESLFVDFDDFTINVKSFQYEEKTPEAKLNIENGTGAGSLNMKNTASVTESNDGGEEYTPQTSTTSPKSTGTGAFATGSGTHAEGDVSTAEGILTHAGYTRTDGTRSIGAHAEGEGTYAKSSASHAEGYHTQALASNSHTEGFFTTVNSAGWSGHAEGRENVVNSRAGHAEGYKNTIEVNAEDSHVEGQYNTLSGVAAHAEGQNNTVSGIAAHVEGSKSSATGNYSHAEGQSSQAQGLTSHAEGNSTKATANYTHAEGDRTEASGSAGHAEGVLTFGKYRSHAEGEGTTAGAIVGDVVDGVTVTASNISNYRAAHAEGLRSKALAVGSHAEGRDTIANGQFAHAEGAGSQASGTASHAGGTSTIAQWDNSTVVGKYNKTTNLSNASSEPLFIVGNGTSASARKNALEVFTDGTAYVDGKKILVDGDAGGGSATIGNVTATATSIDSSKPATATATTSGNDISFAFGIPKGDPGNDYVLTDADKSEIAALVLAQIPNGDEVAYG